MNASLSFNIPSNNDEFIIKDGRKKDEGKTKDLIYLISESHYKDQLNWYSRTHQSGKERIHPKNHKTILIIFTEN